MLGFREMDDGSLVFPKRGDPPSGMPGYQQQPGNPFILIPILPECPFRWKGYFTLPCCPNDRIDFYKCEKGFNVTAKECKKCINSGRRDSAPQTAFYNVKVSHG